MKNAPKLTEEKKVIESHTPQTSMVVNTMLNLDRLAKFASATSAEGLSVVIRDYSEEAFESGELGHEILSYKLNI